jgi:hypothetical protein
MKPFLLLLCILTCAVTHAQVQFESASLATVLKRAANEGKLVFIQVESSDCIHCNEVAAIGLSTEAVGDRVNGTFISLELPVAHPDRATVETRYNMAGRFGTLFLDASGTLLHKYEATSTSATPYLKNIDIAVQKAGESMKISALEDQFYKGNRAPGFIEALLLKKQSLGLSTTALLDEYVASLPADSLRSVRTLVFIARQAPVIGTAGDIALRKDRALFDQAWYGMPLPERVQINYRIASSSMAKAARDRDEAFAHRVAAFAQSVHAPNTVNGIRASTRAMMGYYEDVKDTARYLRTALYFYDRYYMKIPIDSVRNADARAEASQQVRTDTLINGNKVTYTRARRVSPVSQGIAGDLNRAASSLAQLTSDPAYLAIATTWVERALALYQSPEGLDIYARLLYRQGQQEKAIGVEEELIALRRKRKFPTAEEESRLALMKAGRPLGD